MSEISTHTASREVSADALTEANKRAYGDDTLTAIQSFSDAMELVTQDFGAADTLDNYGTGFEVVDNKDTLIDRPFIALNWVFAQSEEFGAEYVVCNIVTKSNEKLVLVDGSSGICKQLRNVTTRRVAEGRTAPQQNLFVPNGLRKSEFDAKDKDKNYILNPDGSRLRGTTYYLS